MLILSLWCGYFGTDHVILFKHLFWSNVDTRHHVLRHFLTCTQFFCQKIITRVIRIFVRTWFLSTVLSLSSKPIIFELSKNITFFLNMFTQVSHTHTHTHTHTNEKRLEQRKRDHVRFIKQGKPLYVSKGKVTKRETRGVLYHKLNLCTRNPATEQASLLLIYKKSSLKVLKDTTVFHVCTYFKGDNWRFLICLKL